MRTKEILARLYPVLRPYRAKLGIAMVIMIIVAGFNALQAYMVKPLLDEIFFRKDQTLLNILPLALLAIFLIKGVFYFTYSYVLEWVGQSIIRDLRNRIYSHLNALSLSFFQQTPTGSLISRIINDVSMLQSSVSHAIIRLLRDFFTVLGLLAVIFWMDWRLALISLIFLPMAAVPVITFGRKFRRISTNYQVQLGEATSQLHETIAGVKVVKAFCMEGFEKKRFSDRMQGLMDTLMFEAKYRCLSHPLVELLGGVGMALIIWFGGMQVLNGSSTPGTFMSFLTALVMLYEPIKGVAKINSTIQSGMAASTRIFTLLDQEAEVQEQKHPVEMAPFSSAITLQNVSFAYDQVVEEQKGENRILTIEGKGEKVLKGLNLEVTRGEVLAVVGPSGSGKTTLAHLIPRFYDVTEGQVSIDGIDVRYLSLYSLRTQIAMVSQQTILFNDTVRNNIAYGLSDCSEDRLLAAAKAAYAYDFISELPQGFDTVIGESGTRLSGGQQQRLSIARALLKDSPILILDEATSSLDTESERKVQRALENLMENRTTIVIAHRLSTIKNADRIAVLKDGVLVEEGSHDELLALQGEYKALYDLQ